MIKTSYDGFVQGVLHGLESRRQMLVAVYRVFVLRPTCSFKRLGVVVLFWSYYSRLPARPGIFGIISSTLDVLFLCLPILFLFLQLDELSCVWLLRLLCILGTPKLVSARTQLFCTLRLYMHPTPSTPPTLPSLHSVSSFASFTPTPSLILIIRLPQA